MGQVVVLDVGVGVYGLQCLVVVFVQGDDVVDVFVGVGGGVFMQEGYGLFLLQLFGMEVIEQWGVFFVQLFEYFYWGGWIGLGFSM